MQPLWGWPSPGSGGDPAGRAVPRPAPATRTGLGEEGAPPAAAPRFGPPSASRFSQASSLAESPLSIREEGLSVMFSPLFKETASAKSACRPRRRARRSWLIRTSRTSRTGAPDSSGGDRSGVAGPCAAPLSPRSALFSAGAGAAGRHSEPGQAAARGAGGTSAGRRRDRGLATNRLRHPAYCRLTHLQPRGQPDVFLRLLAQVA
ncbi:unnamed protein product [Coccothraustes coccothraustes]